MSDVIFVYGSLMKNFHNYEKYLRGHVLDIQPATVHGKLYDMPYKGYPAILDGNDTVHGEVIHVKDLAAILPAIDKMEGYNHQADDEYSRIPKTITLADGSTTVLDVYVYTSKHLDTKFEKEAIYLPDGSWRAFKESL